MKLIAKYNRVNIPITIFVLLISSVAYYFILHFVLLNQVDKDLRVEQQEIIHHIKVNGTLPATSNYKDRQIKFQPTNLTHVKEKFSTESIYNKKEDEDEPFRRIDFLVTQNAQNYMATVEKSEQETEDIVQLILIITFAVIAVLLFILFVSNRFLLGKLWKPFNHTLNQLKDFNLYSTNEIILQPTNVDEFVELNETAILLTQKVRSDYDSLKSFTGNASHEIQTPLAIIKNKIEILSQSEHLDESQVKIINSLNEAASRLSRLNQSLLLLTKIENRQFEQTQGIDLSSVLNKCIENFQEAAELKGIDIEKNIKENISVVMNDSLADIVLSNIILNAIKHNYQGGNIKVNLDEHSLTVSNTGYEPKLQPAELFERFKKDSSSQDSLGLGLSIVKTIADSYGFPVAYYYREQRHILEIKFH
ncbi:MAG: HAMP domain-containing sensor histidine kinase [Ginsengibacter sp.]